ncbi:MAG: bile acid:sodium symporter [Pirellulales bacterium]|nr:bile acid:sodium symporter [Pirellulales bacterium]
MRRAAAGAKAPVATISRPVCPAGLGGPLYEPAALSAILKYRAPDSDSNQHQPAVGRRTFEPLVAAHLDSSANSGRLARWGGWLHRYFLFVLLGTYLLAGLAPGPGAVIRQFSVRLPWGGEERASMLLLGVLLFCAAAVIQWAQIRDLLQRPSVVMIGLLTAWFGPVLLVVVVGPLLSWLSPSETTAGVMVGLALVAAMPVANSSAGWTQNAGGHVALSLGLVVLSIVLSPLATPSLLKIMGWALTADDTAHIEQVVNQFSGWRFILWVILPSLAGAVTAWAAGRERIAAAKAWFRLITLGTILVLNYANASLAIDKAWAHESRAALALASALAVSVSVVGILLAGAQTRLCGLHRPAWIALTFGLSMKHTGLALVLAGEFLKDEPRVIMVVLLTTLAQHVAAAAMDRHMQRWALDGPGPK